VIKRLRIGFLAAALGLLLLPSLALAQKVTIENNTNSAIKELFISNADTNSWDDNVLQAPVAPGAKHDVTFNGQYKMYDLKAVFDSGQEQPYYGINVRTYNYIRLNSSGVEVFK